MRTDFFNEAIVTAMLAAFSGEGDGTPQTGPDDEDLARADVLRERLVALMDRADRTAMQAGMPGELTEAADFAVCAFIDEVLLSSISWRGRADWSKKTLQFSRHGTATAGEDFYRLLDTFLDQTEKKAPVVAIPAGARETANAPAREEPGARDPLHATLEIFALCLAQGFTGMFYGDPAAVCGKLDAIGRFIPAVARRAEPFFLVTAGEAKTRGPLRRVADLLLRFDLLDWALWIAPPVLTALFYRACETRLDRLLQPFLQGGGLP
jgi:type VI protein secretion system component VasF